MHASQQVCDNSCFHGKKVSEESRMVTRSVKAIFSEGVLIPQESLDLEEGENVILSVVGQSVERSLEALRASAGAWKGTNDPEALKESIYCSRSRNSRPQPRL